MSRGGRAPPDISELYSLKVDNISYNTTIADLRRLFDKYGDIGDIHIPRDKYTRQSKGFGFVRFYNRRDAEYAMDRTDGKYMDGRELRVALARYERPIDERGGHRGRGRGRSRSRSRSPRRRDRSRSPRYSRSRSRSRSPAKRDKDSKSPRRSRSRSASKSKSRSRSASPPKNGDAKSRSASRESRD
ncbi:hypothetical protein WR25_17395 [Diploscapter pachys]|uniref:Serine/arginine-rich splicing factor 2 n=1 Tax=Diploscapter pachys TaxID=2018661 RepID=A0A2A2JDU4_9BILA|nr:hypothetical protein WR25_17395 [Diploscapter pachys]